ncbi:hypothetical protein CONLIGDRAFT_454454 [Coniochaeta ligniaria NRRL 30616]|uniref:Phospholipid scramblase n=1 Tax=Coniochaeta ligniaria NRRL 30616 TaxID=1408157 RepID=A0A1J7J3Q8_9PEZI|nr:hypothetical protein CONLIGDRAFT_454454 [Coniochaeta ligniaria NRRL 30616]
MSDAKTPAAAPRLGLETLEDDVPPAEELPAYSPPSKHPLNPQVPLAQQLQVAAGPSSSVNRQFPPEFNLYSANLLGRTFNLGEHQNAPIYVVSIHTGWSGNPDVMLHTSTSANSPPLATANFRTFTNDTTIKLPPLNPRSYVTETTLKGSMFGRTWSFSIEIPGPNGQLRSEPFEWRHSRGEDVNTLGSVWGTGWKLVRLLGEGKEVVAVFTEGTMSLSKKFSFKFRGAGETGVLGERWAVMAVISAMAIWEKNRRTKNNSAN